jgi:hypothetical protein
MELLETSFYAVGTRTFQRGHLPQYHGGQHRALVAHLFGAARWASRR